MEKRKLVSSLYRISSFSVAKNIQLFLNELRSLPVQQICDVYEQLFERRDSIALLNQLSDYNHFLRILRSTVDDWSILFKCIQLIASKQLDIGTQLASTSIRNLCCQKHDHLLQKIRNSILTGMFFTECGMFESASIALSCVKVCEVSSDEDMLKTALELWTRLIHVYTSDCKFLEAKKALSSAVRLLNIFSNQKNKCTIDKSMFFTAQSQNLFALSRYGEAHTSSLSALAELSPDLPYKTIIDTLRQAAKTSIVKRLFKQAGALIKQAVCIAGKMIGENHPKYAECLSDYAFYLLNVDGVTASVEIYKIALEIRERIFGHNNLLTASSHEDLAYALYVRDYSSGNFFKAKEHAETAIQTFTDILPPDHLLLASSKRVKALILEEIAIDSTDAAKRDQLLKEAENLHLESLKLARNAFGESNVQTAKHYGNLGRLYQSMKRYKEAEEMHLRAIKIKESLLGNEDYEVALSLGHLASLYNYDMAEYSKAEQLYIKSIRIGCSLFGQGYSGLEYDYRGLISLYANTGNYVEMARYHLVFADWQELRNNANNSQIHQELYNDESISISDFLNSFRVNFTENTKQNVS